MLSIPQFPSPKNALLTSPLDRMSCSLSGISHSGMNLGFLRRLWCALVLTSDTHLLILSHGNSTSTLLNSLPRILLCFKFSVLLREQLLESTNGFFWLLRFLVRTRVHETPLFSYTLCFLSTDRSTLLTIMLLFRLGPLILRFTHCFRPHLKEWSHSFDSYKIA
jgi:hypothetical protein